MPHPGRGLGPYVAAPGTLKRAARRGRRGVATVGSEKQCRVCGGVLDCHDYGGGSVWSCGTHGVREWHFGAGPHWSRAPVPGAAALDRSPTAPKPPRSRA
jgi:hypothetical protein